MFLKLSKSFKKAYFWSSWKARQKFYYSTFSSPSTSRCSVCDRGFTSRAILNQHYQTHPTTRKILSCVTCNFTFNDKKQAKTHDELFHPDRVPFKCNVCRESFKHAHSLKSHMRHKHKPDKSFEQQTKSESSDENENEFFHSYWKVSRSLWMK